MTCPTARAIIIHYTLSTADWAGIYSLGNIARTSAPLDDARKYERPSRKSSSIPDLFLSKPPGAARESFRPAEPEVVG